MEALAREQISNHAELEAQQEALEHCVTHLTEDDRRIIEFRYTSGSTIQELSRQTGHTAKKLYHALDRIRRQLNLCVNQQLDAEGWAT
jgi:RNA polymerase sigma-70 factor (ECF subfamily)